MTGAATPPTDDGLSQTNPSATDDIVVRRGQDAMERKRRSYEDWIDIGEALDVGRTDSMRAAHINEPKGKRYDKAMGVWLHAHGFHLIDKGTRNRLRECLKRRAEIEKWRARLTEAERFRFNHPDAVLRKWRAKTVVPDPNAPPKVSAVAKLKESVIHLEEQNFRMRKEIERGGGDLWTAEDTPEHIAKIMADKLSSAKAERVARAILKLLKEKKAAQPKRDAAASAEERNALYAVAEIESPTDGGQAEQTNK